MEKIASQVCLTLKDGVTFDSQFDSGNLGSAELLKDPYNYNLYVANDCQNLISQTTIKTWFYFSIEGIPEDTEAKFTFKGINNQTKLFQQGHQFVYRNNSSFEFKRILDNNLHKSIKLYEDNTIDVTFKHKFNEQKVFFAYTYPYSLQDVNISVQKCLNNIQIGNYKLNTILNYSKSNIPVNLIVLSSNLYKQSQQIDAIDGSFPLNNLPFKFANKKTIFISARVHPGEVPSQFVFQGILQYLCSNSQHAQILLDNYVFYLVPVINVDGVVRGHYRMDINGQNLNRYYQNPDKIEQPQIYSIVQLIKHLNEKQNFHAYFDLHAHAQTKGCFIFGNKTEKFCDQVNVNLFSKILSLNSPFLDYSKCNFSERLMKIKDKTGTSREGVGRVAIYRMTGVNLCYTLECNYNIGETLNKVPERQSYNQNKENNNYSNQNKCIIINNKDPQSEQVQFYTPYDYQELGKAFLYSLLDYDQITHNSIIPATQYKNIQTLKFNIAYQVSKQTPFRLLQYNRQLNRLLGVEADQQYGIQMMNLYLETKLEIEIKKNAKTIKKKTVLKQKTVQIEVPNQQSKLQIIKLKMNNMQSQSMKKCVVNQIKPQLSFKIKKQSSSLKRAKK